MDTALAEQIPTEVWARLVAVHRTLRWAGGPARFVGVNCARLLSQVRDLPDLPQASAALLDQLDPILATLDDLEGDARDGAIRSAQEILSTVVKPELVGTLLPPAERVGHRVVPGRRRRGGAKKDDAASTSAASTPAPQVEGASTAQPDPVPAPAPALEAAQAGPAQPEVAEVEAPRREQPPRRGRRRGGKAEPAERTVEPAPRRLPYGHARGTGAPVSSLSDLSADTLAALEAHGLNTVGDLLELTPVDHVRHPQVALDALGADMASGVVAVRGRLRTRCTRLGTGYKRLEVVLVGPTGASLVCRWLGFAPRGWADWRAGQDLALIGEPGDEDGVLYEAEPVGIDGRGSGFMPVYQLDGLDDRTVRDAVAAALRVTLGALDDRLVKGVRERHRLMSLDEALRDAHFPANTAGRGRVRLAFEELLLLQLGVALRAGRGQAVEGVAHKVLHGAVANLHSQFGIHLDDGQERAFSEIRRDLRRATPMTRLLQGDEGTGKGLVALLAAVVAAESGAQVAMVSPDALSAERQFMYAEPLLRAVGIAPKLFGERPNHAQMDAVRRGEAQVVFGTRAILAKDVTWRRLGLAVVEERGTYGAVLNGLFQGRQPRPDLLVVTRVPIPSSLTFTVFGEFDVSVIPTLERPRVSTRVVEAAQREEAYDRVWVRVAAGRQAYVVFPVRDGRDLLGPDDARRMAQALQSASPSQPRVGIYCSAMGREERQRVYDDFQHRRLDVLICTTYIEDAPAVSNATEVIVEAADLHDIERLHRLRGHVGRGIQAGRCAFVLSPEPDEAAREVVEVVATERDGFRLAELDLKVRGSQALLGDRAAEAPSFRWAQPERDRELLLRARGEAFDLLRRDPGFQRSRNLARAVAERWGGWLGENVVETQPRRSGGSSRRRRRRRRR